MPRQRVQGPASGAFPGLRSSGGSTRGGGAGAGDAIAVNGRQESSVAVDVPSGAADGARGPDHKTHARRGGAIRHWNALSAKTRVVATLGVALLVCGAVVWTRSYAGTGGHADPVAAVFRPRTDTAPPPSTVGSPPSTVGSPPSTLVSGTGVAANAAAWTTPGSVAAAVPHADPQQSAPNLPPTPDAVLHRPEDSAQVRPHAANLNAEAAAPAKPATASSSATSAPVPPLPPPLADTGSTAAQSDDRAGAVAMPRVRGHASSEAAMQSPARTSDNTRQDEASQDQPAQAAPTTAATPMPSLPRPTRVRPPRVDSLSSGSQACLFLMSTDDHSGANKGALSPLQACAVEGFSRHNPNASVCVYATGVNTLAQPFLWDRGNVELREMRAGELLTDVGGPFQSWWTTVYKGNEQAELSQMLRLALLYAYGGVYVDLDMWSLKSLAGLRNTVGLAQGSPDAAAAETRDPAAAGVNAEPVEFENSVLVFDRGHPYLAAAAEAYINLARRDRAGAGVAQRGGEALKQAYARMVAGASDASRPTADGSTMPGTTGARARASGHAVAASSDGGDVTVLPPPSFFPWSRTGVVGLRDARPRHFVDTLIEQPDDTYGVTPYTAHVFAGALRSSVRGKQRPRWYPRLSVMWQLMAHSCRDTFNWCYARREEDDGRTCDLLYGHQLVPRYS